MPLYGYTTISLSIHYQSVDIWVFLDLGNDEQWCCEHLCTNLYADMCFHFLQWLPRSEIAGSHGKYMLSLKKKLPNFSEVVVPFCIPMSTVWRVQLLRILSNTWYLLVNFFNKDFFLILWRTPSNIYHVERFWVFWIIAILVDIVESYHVCRFFRFILEREHAWAGRGGERGRENPKQILHWTWSWIQGWISRHQDHDLSWNWEPIV